VGLSTRTEYGSFSVPVKVVYRLLPPVKAYDFDVDVIVVMLDSLVDRYSPRGRSSRMCYKC